MASVSQPLGSEAAVASHPARGVLASAAFALSGTAGLVFEVVWFRMLGITGSAGPSLAAGTVTAAYLTGLAVGSAVGGRWADRVRRPLLAYALLEGCVALCAAAVPTVIALIAAVPTTSGARVFLGAAVLLLPTLAMGMTLPLLAVVLSRGAEGLGRTTGMLYGINTLGAMGGALWAGWIGIPAWGLEASHELALGIQIAASAMGLTAALGCPAREPPLARLHTVSAPRSWPLLTITSMASATAMMVQVAWVAFISKSEVNATRAFANTVCVYLLGLAIGGFLAARFTRPDRATTALSRILLGTGGCLGLGIWVATQSGLSLGLGSSLGRTFTTLLPATIGMGMLFPAFVCAASSMGCTRGLSVGYTSAASASGAVAGALGATAIVPAVGALTSLALAIVMYPVLSAVVRWGFRWQTR